jgi:capsular exopolysaccharide synthesis family protein
MSKTETAIAPRTIRRALGAPTVAASAQWTEDGLPAQLWAVFARRWRIIVATVVVAVTATGIGCLLVTPRYRARATLHIEARGAHVLGGADRFGDAQDPFASAKYDYYQTQFYLLRSPSVARRVIEDLDLANDHRFMSTPAPSLVDSETPAAGAAPTDTALIRRYLRQLSVQPVRGTRLVNVAFESEDADLAAQLANAHARLFVRGGLEQLYDAMQQIRSFLQGKLNELQENMYDAETSLLNFQATHHLLPLDLRRDVGSERLMDLSRRLTQAETERITLEAEYQLIQRREYDSLPAVLTNPLIQQLREDFNRLELEHSLMASKWRPSYPPLRRLKKQVEHARQLLKQETESVLASVEARYLTSKGAAERLQQELAAQRHSLLERKGAEGELLTLARESETTRALYDNLLARVKELDIAGDVEMSNMRVAELALPPQRPSVPNTRLNLLVSLLTGLLLGTGLAFLRESWDCTIRDAEHVQRAGGLGTLAVIPEFEGGNGAASVRSWTWSRTTLPGRPEVTRSRREPNNGSANGRAARRHARAVIAAPPLLLGNGFENPISAEAYRTLRTSLLVSGGTTPPRVIVITSSAGTEGKTTTAVNTAASFATCGASVLLVDGDLRLPRCHEVVALPVEPGLSEYLNGDLSEAPVQATHVQNLSFLAAGRPVRNPTELLTSRRMWDFLQEARDRFDFIVVDSPPLLAVSDGLLLAATSDGVILVVEKGRTREDHVRTALVQLHQTGAVVLGAVLNRGEVEHEYYQYTWPVADVTAESTDADADADAAAAPEQN